MSTRKRIEAAYFACERLCNKHNAAWFTEACQVAERQEREHRLVGKRFTRGEASYRLPTKTAGMYFAVRWFLDSEFQAPRSWAEAATVREDSLLGLAARDRVRDSDLDAWLALCSEYQDVRNLDYASVFPRRAA